VNAGRQSAGNPLFPLTIDVICTKMAMEFFQNPLKEPDAGP